MSREPRSPCVAGAGAGIVTRAFGNMLETAIDFFQNQKIWTATIFVGLAALTYWKPKDTFKVVLIVSVGGALLYVGSFLFDLTSSGIDDSRKFTANPNIEVD